MRFVPMRIPGAYIVEPEPVEDERGSFARTFDRETFVTHGLTADIAQCSFAKNHRRGTLRGLHYQAAPHEEAKVVTCTRGRAFDVVVDLRPGSPARFSWDAVELTAEGRRAVYVPTGCAHGYQTLEDDTELYYQISVPHVPDAARGVRFDDDTLAIAWPLPVTSISQRDRTFGGIRS